VLIWKPERGKKLKNNWSNWRGKRLQTLHNCKTFIDGNYVWLIQCQSVPDRCVPWMMRPLYDTSLWLNFPLMNCPMDGISHGKLILVACVPNMMDSSSPRVLPCWSKSPPPPLFSRDILKKYTQFNWKTLILTLFGDSLVQVETYRVVLKLFGIGLVGPHMMEIHVKKDLWY
jgi:hypothetical protein